MNNDTADRARPAHETESVSWAPAYTISLTLLYILLF